MITEINLILILVASVAIIIATIYINKYVKLKEAFETKDLEAFQEIDNYQTQLKASERTTEELKNRIFKKDVYITLLEHKLDFLAQFLQHLRTNFPKYIRNEENEKIPLKVKLDKDLGYLITDYKGNSLNNKLKLNTEDVDFFDNLIKQLKYDDRETVITLCKSELEKHGIFIY